jgi:glycosyltransferase involved in cell wall biosynthesis
MPETHWAFIHPFQLRLQRGIEVYLWNLAAALAQQGIRVDILTWNGPLEIPDYARVPGIKLYKVPDVRYFQTAFAVPFYLAWLLKGKYQHVFVHFAGYGEGLALRLASLLRSVPFSVVFHFPLSQVPQRYKEFEKWNFQHDAQHLIGVSKATGREVEQWAGRLCNVIGHGVETQRFHPDPALRMQVRRELGIEQNAPILISVAALEERKGIQWVIQAMPEALKEIPDIHYIVIGDGQYRDTLVSMLADLQLESCVHLLGIKLDVHPYLCAADIMMVLARGEASSISLLEALACELTAITSDCPPFDELIREAWGLRVDETSLHQVVSTVVGLIKDPESRVGMGKAGRVRIMEKHTWPQIAKEYKELTL